MDTYYQIGHLESPDIADPRFEKVEDAYSAASRFATSIDKHYDRAIGIWCMPDGELLAIYFGGEVYTA